MFLHIDILFLARTKVNRVIIRKETSRRKKRRKSEIKSARGRHVYCCICGFRRWCLSCECYNSVKHCQLRLKSALETENSVCSTCSNAINDKRVLLGRTMLPIGGAVNGGATRYHVGAFATRNYCRGEVVVTYGGAILHDIRRKKTEDHDYVLGIGNGGAVDGKMSKTLGPKLNHHVVGCHVFSTNVTRGQTRTGGNGHKYRALVAIRDIVVGEELYLNYGSGYKCPDRLTKNVVLKRIDFVQFRECHFEQEALLRKLVTS